MEQLVFVIVGQATLLWSIHLDTVCGSVQLCSKWPTTVTEKRDPLQTQ